MFSPSLLIVVGVIIGKLFNLTSGSSRRAVLCVEGLRIKLKLSDGCEEEKRVEEVGDESTYTKNTNLISSNCGMEDIIIIP